MCGRYFLDTLPEFLIKRLSVREVAPFEPRYNIAPSQQVLAARSMEAGFEMVQLRWGLVPFWAKDEKIGNRMINARCETVADKPAFRNAWRRRRALVPASGFYEWQRTGSVKQPYAIQADNREPFAIGAIWERWGKGDIPLESVALLTMEAAPGIAEIHHRMPAIIQQDDLQCWLTGSTDDAADCLARARRQSFTFHPVSRRVNRPQNNDPELLHPVALETESDTKTQS